MGKAEGSFAADGVSAAFATATDGSLDEGVFAGGVKVRIEIAKKMTGAGEIFWGGSYTKRSVGNITSYSKWCGVKGKTVKGTKKNIIASTGGIITLGRRLDCVRRSADSPSCSPNGYC